MTTSLARTTPAAPMAIRCPRCGTEMITHERSGIVLDQCRDCRGFFLDHGELERLVAAEGGAWLGPVPRLTASGSLEADALYRRNQPSAGHAQGSHPSDGAARHSRS